MKFSILFVLFFSAFAGSATPGQLLKVTHLADAPAAMSAGARNQVCPAEVGAKKTYGFKRYRVDYMTTDLHGKDFPSSGLLEVPDVSGSFPMVVYQHGTVMARRELPSESELYGEGDAIGFCFTSLGYVAVLADYLGYGDGSGVHPYLHADSEAWVARDLMRAAKTALAQLQVQTNGKLFITGYSQGGHAAMALLRAIEQDPTHEFTVTAAAPMAGPYAISSSLDEIASTPSQHSSAEAALLVVGLNQLYPLYKDVNEIFQAPYAAQVEPLFDGSHGWPEVLSVLSMKPTELFQPAYLKEVITNPAAELNVALRANDVFKWTPKTPLHLYHGHGDTEVPYSNSEKAYGYMKAQGANIELINLGETVDHIAGFPLAIGQAALWFETF